jgi:hypothetical protein
MMMALLEDMDFAHWKQLYKKMVYYEIELQSSDETGMEEVMETQKSEANKEFAKFIERNYLNYIPYDAEEAPLMSHTLLPRKVLPEIQEDEPVFFFLIDNLRYDQWKFIEPVIRGALSSRRR